MDTCVLHSIHRCLLKLFISRLCAAVCACQNCLPSLLAGIALQVLISIAYYLARRPLAALFTPHTEVIDEADGATLAAAAAAIGYAMLMPANMVRSLSVEVSVQLSFGVGRPD